MNLTITIPTYNRKSSLLERISELCKCEGIEDIKILIIDNNSDEDPTHDILRLCETKDIQVNIIRNKANVGLSANICKCFENTETEWMWLLGDDDPIASDSIQTITQFILDVPSNAVMLKFGGEAMIPAITEYHEINGIESLSKFMNTAWRYSSMLFISNSVFKTAQLNKYLNVAYMWAYSYAPHLAIVLPAMRDGGVTCIKPKSILKDDLPENKGGWNAWRLRMGTATLGEIEGCEVMADHSLRGIFRDWIGNFWISLPIIIFRSGDRPASFWKAYLHRVASVSKGWAHFGHIFAIYIYIPLIQNNFFRNILHKLMGKRSDLQNMNRL